MSLEAAIEKLTASVDRQIALMEKLASGKAASTATTTTATGTKAADKKPETKALTEADLRAAATGYLGVNDADERTARKAKVSKMLEHYGVAKVTDLTADKYEEAINHFKTLTLGGTPEFMAEDDMV